MTQRAPHVAVVVLGDLGRSPRMQYHAASLAAAGATVSLVGLAGEAPIAAVADDPRIEIHTVVDRLSYATPPTSRTIYLLRAAVRSLLQLVDLLVVLGLRSRRPDFLLVQTPPAFPSLPVAWAVARLRGAKLIIDWHNLGDSLLALKLPADHLAVRAVRRTEREIARRADGHLCVSRRMAVELRKTRGVEATVVHDRPQSSFRPLAAHERRALLERLGLRTAGEPEARLVVTATSWTPDEDLGLLLEAVIRLDDRIRAQRRSDPLRRIAAPVFVITGKGPLRERFEARLRDVALAHVKVRTAWLEWRDYRGLLGAADLGLSLHRSSSGVDLPMKVLDMFGAGLPVCALDYGPCLDELIRPGRNGLLFHSSGELASVLYDLVVDPTENPSLLRRLREGAQAERGLDWSHNWQRTAAPCFGLAGVRPTEGSGRTA